MEFLFSSLSLMAITLAMLFLAFSLWKAARRIFNVGIVVDLIFFFVFVKLLFYYLLPEILRINSDYQFEREEGVAITSLIYVYSIELVSWAMWGVALLCTFNMVAKNKKKVTLAEFVVKKCSESKIILTFLVLGFLVMRTFTLALIEGGPILEIFKSLFFYAGLACGPVLMVLSLRYYGKSLFILGVFSSVFSILSLSTRGALVYLTLFCLFLTWFILRDRVSKLIAVSLVVVFSAVYFVFGGLIFGSFAMDESGQLSVDVGIASHKKGERSVLGDIEWRFGAPTRLGTAFIDLYGRGEAAGFNPIKHSLMGFLPRFIDPDKPYPSTVQGDDIYSQGMYVIYRERYGYDTFSMVEFPTGGHFYWEFGLAGVFFLSAISGIYIALCANWFSRFGIVALPLMIAIFKPWGYMDPKIWVSDIAMQIYQIILPLIALFFAVQLMRYVLMMFKKAAISVKQSSSCAL